MAIKITTSINSGTKGPGGSTALKGIKDLEIALYETPERIQNAVMQAGLISKEYIEEDLKKRGSAGKYFDVNIKTYGPFGLRVQIEEKTSSPSSGSYNPKIGTAIFFNSEMGYQGRRSFESPKAGGTKATMKITEWDGNVFQEGLFYSKVSIPKIGPFYFSKKRGMKEITIKKMALGIINENLNRKFMPIRTSLRRGRGDFR